MNDDHAEATRLYATKLLGEDDGPWRITGLDPDGLTSPPATAPRACRSAEGDRPARCGRCW